MASERPIIPNILADRYASTPMLHLFSPVERAIAKRDFWIKIMKGQASQGLPIPQAAIDSYERVKFDIDLPRLRAKELILRHDEKAEIEDFNELAGHQFVHLGLTSRDHSDNVEQKLYKDGMLIIRDRAVATLARYSSLAAKHSELFYAGRTHNVAAQPSLIGKLFSDAGEELLIGFDRLETLIEKYPLRGLKGAMGTQTDQLQLLGDQEKVDNLESIIAESLGFKNVLGSTGQVYPRSLDFEVVSTLEQLVCGPASLSMTLRLMAGNEQFTEGFKKGQVGSSAMPHKMNARTCERIQGLKDTLAGYVTMAEKVSGRQNYGGDVSDSSTRRVFMPDSFFTVDGIFQAMLTICDEGGFFPAVLEREFNRYLPFLTSSRLLITAVDNGVGRETAHEAIKEHSVKVALEMREEGLSENDLLDRLANDPRLGIPKEKLEEVLSNRMEFVGSAPRQIANFIKKVRPIIKKYPEAAAYMPEEIL